MKIIRVLVFWIYSITYFSVVKMLNAVKWCRPLEFIFSFINSIFSVIILTIMWYKFGWIYSVPSIIAFIIIGWFFNLKMLMSYDPDYSDEEIEDILKIRNKIKLHGFIIMFGRKEGTEVYNENQEI